VTVSLGRVGNGVGREVGLGWVVPQEEIARVKVIIVSPKRQPRIFFTTFSCK
jgi:hypothetical protein